MKRKCSFLLAFTLSATACFTVFPACSSDGLAEELITALQNEEQIVAMTYDMRFDMKATADEETQKMSVEFTGAENLETGDADFFLEGVANDGKEKETIFQDVFVRADAVLSTDTYENKQDGGTQTLTLKNSVIEVLDEAMGDVLSSDITLEGLDEELIGSFLRFAEEYNGLSKWLETYVLDVNKLLYNVAKDILPVVKDLDEETTVGEVLEKRQIKRLINALTQDKTAGEFYEELMSSETIEDFFVPIEPQNEKGSIYDYLVSWTKTEGFMDPATDGDTLLYDATVNEVLLNVFDVSLEDFVEDTREWIEDDVKNNGLTISLDSVSEGMELCLSDIVIKYQLDSGSLKSQELSLKVQTTVETQSVEMEFSLKIGVSQEQQELIDLSERNVSTMRETMRDGYYISTNMEYVTPYKKSKVWVYIEDDHISKLVFKDSNAQELVYDERQLQADTFAYSIDGVEMKAKVGRFIEKDMLEIELYRADQPNEIFNYIRIPVSIEKGNAIITYREWKADNEYKGEESAVVDGLRLKLNADGNSYRVVGVADDSLTSVNIPETYDGKPITYIVDGAFEYNTTITSVNIPATVKMVGKNAFHYCSALTTANVSASVIGDYAFYVCTSLESVTFSEVSTIKDCAFLSCMTLGEVALPESVRCVGSYAFSGCKSLKTASLTTNASFLSDYIFSDSAIETIMYSGSMKEWRTLKKGGYWYFKMGNVVIECEDGKLDKYDMEIVS